MNHKLEDFEDKLQDIEIHTIRSGTRVTTEKGDSSPRYIEKRFSDDIRKLQNTVKDLSMKLEQ